MIFCHTVRLSHSKYTKNHNASDHRNIWKVNWDDKTGGMSRYTETYGNPHLSAPVDEERNAHLTIYDVLMHIMWGSLDICDNLTILERLRREIHFGLESIRLRKIRLDQENSMRKFIQKLTWARSLDCTFHKMNYLHTQEMFLLLLAKENVITLQIS